MSKRNKMTMQNMTAMNKTHIAWTIASISIFILLLLLFPGKP